jgi:hypothetical protein
MQTFVEPWVCWVDMTSLCTLFFDNAPQNMHHNYIGSVKGLSSQQELVLGGLSRDEQSWRWSPPFFTEEY